MEKLLYDLDTIYTTISGLDIFKRFFPFRHSHLYLLLIRLSQSGKDVPFSKMGVKIHPSAFRFSS